MTDVLFWDIDGTLLTTARAGIFAFEQALRDVCDAEPDFSALQTAGLTDGEVATLAIEACGREADPGTAAAVLQAYEGYLPDRLGWRQGEVLPGVLEVLADLRDRAGVRLLLLTGNTEPGARAKLGHYGLSEYFDGGGFCVDGSGREQIARRAYEEHVRASGELNGGRVYVIGDTPHDVRCGQAIGARTVAVATGPGYSLEELQRCEPWLALESLPEPDRFAALLDL